jgi:predicted transcriptional regulator
VAGGFISEEELKKRVEYLEALITKQNPVYPKYTTIRITGETLEKIDEKRLNSKESNDNVLKRVFTALDECQNKKVAETKT